MEKKESDEDNTQREEQHAGPLTVPQQESEDTTQRDELREEPLTVPQESDEDDSQREEERAEPLTVPQENNEGGSQRQEQRAESFTMVQDNVPQEVDDVHSSHGLTEEQSIISILSFRLRHNTTDLPDAAEAPATREFLFATANRSVVDLGAR
ncbi:unnamed protein product [Pleuronectes platessa]|uniref:Uncharacterized protein n=1 Tax=Pleuronectes platessa TaxID=8262 RepID=A0A9N7YWR0_PLEPL|nr:unnamed protein product [Pleuronectes platessa]